MINLQYIKNRRKVLKINQAEMAVVLGLGSAANYGTYELGKAEFKADHLPKLCEILNCSITELYEEGTPLRSFTIEEMRQTMETINKLTRFIKKGDGA